MNLLHYLKYFLFHLVGLTAAAALITGGAWITAGLLVLVSIYLAGDAVFGDDTSIPALRRPGILTFQLWMALPLLAVIVFLSVWAVSSRDALGIGALVRQLFGCDALAARAATHCGHHVCGALLTGLMIRHDRHHPGP